MRGIIRTLLALLIAGAAALLVYLYVSPPRTEPRVVTREVRNAILIPEPVSFHPLTATSPAGVWLAQRLAPGLYRKDPEGRFAPVLAEGQPIVELVLILNPTGDVRLPNTAPVTMKQIDHYLLPMREAPGSPVSAITRIEQTGKEIRINLDPFSATSVDDILDLLNLRRRNAAIDIRTEFSAIVTLRKEIPMPDGKPLTAREIAASMELRRKGAIRPSDIDTFEHVKEIKAVDNRTIRIICDSLSRRALDLLTTGISLPGSPPTAFLPPPYRYNAPTLSRDSDKISARIGGVSSHNSADDWRVPSVQIRTAVIFNLRNPRLNNEGLRRRLQSAAAGETVKGIAPLSLTMLVDPSDAAARKAAEMIVLRWKASGIDVTAPISYEPRHLQTRKFDVYVGAVPADEIDLYARFHSYQSAAGMNYAGYSNIEVDRLLEMLDRTLNGHTAGVITALAYEKIRGDVPWFVLDDARPLTIRAHGTGVTLLKSLADGCIPLK